MFFECRQLVTVTLFRSSCQSHVLSHYGFVPCQTRVRSQLSFVRYNYCHTCHHSGHFCFVLDITDMFTREFVCLMLQTCLLENSCF